MAAIPVETCDRLARAAHRADAVAQLGVTVTANWYSENGRVGQYLSGGCKNIFTSRCDQLNYSICIITGSVPSLLTVIEPNLLAVR